MVKLGDATVADAAVLGADWPPNDAGAAKLAEVEVC